MVSGDTSALTVLTAIDGGFAPTFHALPPGTRPTAVSAADLDGDLLPDLVLAAAGANATLLFKGSAEGTVDAMRPLDFSLRQVSGADALLLVADLDSNGWKDLLQIDQASGDVTSYLALGCGGEAQFRRGDGDLDGVVGISDAIRILSYLFAGGAMPGCQDAADANDNGRINIGDPIFLLEYLFVRGAEPPAPGPSACGPDAESDALEPCEALCYP